MRDDLEFNRMSVDEAEHFFVGQCLDLKCAGLALFVVTEDGHRLNIVEMLPRDTTDHALAGMYRRAFAEMERKMTLAVLARGLRP